MRLTSVRNKISNRAAPGKTPAPVCKSLTVFFAVIFCFVPWIPCDAEQQAGDLPTLRVVDRQAGLPALQEIKVLALPYNPDGTVIEFDVLSVPVKVTANSADSVKVKVNDKEKLSVVPDKGHACFSVSLDVGINKIWITAVKGDTVVDEASLRVFRRSELESGYKNPPEGFQSKLFHAQDFPECAECHVMRPNDADRKPVSIASFSRSPESRGDKSDMFSKSTCYSCHKAITSLPYVHGPASVWSCLSCHNPDASPVYSVKKPDTAVCFNCHVEQKEEWSGKKYIHGPVNTGKCATCHSPHSAENPFNLFKPAWDLCVSCHVDNGSGRHIIAGYVYGDSHPTRGKPDPLRNGKDLTCASCHNPHASDYPRLWALSARSPFELCQKCHNK